MTSYRQPRIRIDRRTTIKWLAATMAAVSVGCSTDRKFLGDEIPPAPDSNDGLLGAARAPDNIGYGTDPDRTDPIVPWSRTMTEAQLVTASALCDTILPADDRSPAASAVGVPDFIDEWVSAPYSQQQDDREKIFAGLEQLEQQSRHQFGRRFDDAEDAQKSELIDALLVSDPAGFFNRFRYLTVGAFYTTRDGIEDIGYVGNVAVSGEYPGPTEEAMAHLAAVLKQLDLSLP